MIWHALVFYVFSGVAIASALLVIASRNPVHSVLFLILTFFTAAGLFVLMGAEFLGLILIVVYVGAVAVLFLFIVMMLDIDFAELRAGGLQYLPVGALVGVVLLAELALIVASWQVSERALGVAPSPMPATPGLTNAEALGRVLYTDYVYLFQAAGMILLVAMVGAIVLTLRRRQGVKRQSVGRQVGRRRKDAVALVSVRPGQGI